MKNNRDGCVFVFGGLVTAFEASGGSGKDDFRHSLTFREAFAVSGSRGAKSVTELRIWQLSGFFAVLFVDYPALEIYLHLDRRDSTPFEAGSLNTARASRLAKPENANVFGPQGSKPQAAGSRDSGQTHAGLSEAWV